MATRTADHSGSDALPSVPVLPVERGGSEHTASSARDRALPDARHTPPAAPARGLIPGRVKKTAPPRITFNGKTYAMVPKELTNPVKFNAANVRAYKDLIGTVLTYGIPALVADNPDLIQDKIQLGGLRIVQYVAEPGEDEYGDKIELIYTYRDKKGKLKRARTEITNVLKLNRQEDTVLVCERTKAFDGTCNHEVLTAKNVYIKAAQILAARALDTDVEVPATGVAPFKLNPLAWDALSDIAKAKHKNQPRTAEASDSRADASATSAAESPVARAPGEVRQVQEAVDVASGAQAEPLGLFDVSDEELTLDNLPRLSNTEEKESEWWKAYLQRGMLSKLPTTGAALRIQTKRTVRPHEYTEDEAKRLLEELATFKVNKRAPQWRIWGCERNLKNAGNGFSDKRFLRRLLLLLTRAGLTYTPPGQSHPLPPLANSGSVRDTLRWKQFIQEELGMAIAGRHNGLNVPALTDGLHGPYGDLALAYRHLIDDIFELMVEMDGTGRPFQAPRTTELGLSFSRVRDGDGHSAGTGDMATARPVPHKRPRSSFSPRRGSRVVAVDRSERTHNEAPPRMGDRGARR